MKLPPENLNLSFCPTHPTNIYTCGVTIAPRVCGSPILLSNTLKGKIPMPKLQFIQNKHKLR